MIVRTATPAAHSITVPNHRPIKVGTLASILNELAIQRQTSVEKLLAEMKLL